MKTKAIQIINDIRSFADDSTIRLSAVLAHISEDEGLVYDDNGQEIIVTLETYRFSGDSVWQKIEDYIKRNNLEVLDRGDGSGEGIIQTWSINLSKKN